MDSLIFELQIVFYFQLFLSANVRHKYGKIWTVLQYMYCETDAGDSDAGSIAVVESKFVRHARRGQVFHSSYKVPRIKRQDICNTNIGIDAQ